MAKSSSKVKNLNKIFETLGVNTSEIPEPIENERRDSHVRLENDCGKVCYPSERQVKQAISSRLNKGANTSKLRSYFCKDCASWHMSSSYRQ